MKKIILFGLGLLMALWAWAQPSNVQQPKNALKLELVGPIIMARIVLPFQFAWKRISVRYERRLEQPKFLSIVGDAEYRTRWEGFNVNGSGTAGDHGLTHQREISLVGGGRIYANLVDAKRFTFLCFAEPRLALTWRHAQLEHLGTLNEFLSYEIVNELGLVPRLRSGIGFGFGRVLGLEISGDLGRHKILGDGRHQWEIYPELSLVFRF